MAVEPCRYRKALGTFGEGFKYGLTCKEVRISLAVVNLGAQQLDRHIERFVRVRGQPSAKICGFHRPGASAGRDVPPLAGHRPPKCSDDVELRVGPLHRMTSHHRNNIGMFGEVLRQGVVDGVIVEPSGERIEHRAVRSLGVLRRPGENLRIERVVFERGNVARHPPVEQLALCVEVRPVRIKGQAGQPWKDDGTRLENMFQRRWRQPRTEKRRADT